MILFSACCICGLIGGILNFQFLRALTKKSSALYSLHLTSMTLACIGIGGCTLSSWLTCRLASYEQRRMFSEREHSLHHSHEMADKVSWEYLLICCVSPQTTQCSNIFQWQLGNSIFRYNREMKYCSAVYVPFCYRKLFLDTVSFLQYAHFNKIHPLSALSHCITSLSTLPLNIELHKEGKGV